MDIRTLQQLTRRLPPGISPKRLSIHLQLQAIQLLLLLLPPPLVLRTPTSLRIRRTLLLLEDIKQRQQVMAMARDIKLGLPATPQQPLDIQQQDIKRRPRTLQPQVHIQRRRRHIQHPLLRLRQEGRIQPPVLIQPQALIRLLVLILVLVPILQPVLTLQLALIPLLAPILQLPLLLIRQQEPLTRHLRPAIRRRHQVIKLRRDLPNLSVKARTVSLCLSPRSSLRFVLSFVPASSTAPFRWDFFLRLYLFSSARLFVEGPVLA